MPADDENKNCLTGKTFLFAAKVCTATEIARFWGLPAAGTAWCKGSRPPQAAPAEGEAATGNWRVRGTGVQFCDGSDATSVAQ
jgi:hypothetical protein